MKFLSVCSGIEAASLAWNPLGWEAVAFSEIEPYACALLAERYPGIPNWGDMTKYKSWPDANFDLLCGGTPCQSFSIAGLRAGLDDPRGQLMLTFGAVARRYRPRWILWENVPNVLSTNGGRDFGTFLGMLAELGYGFAYRICNAQYFRVPQRRRRVFVIGYLGDWRRAAAVLFERHSLSGYPPPSRETWEADPGTALHGAEDDSVSMCLNTRSNRLDAESQTLIPHPAVAYAMRGREGGAMPEAQGDQVSALCAASGGSSRDIVAFSNTAGNTNLGISDDDAAPPITTRNGDPGNICFTAKDYGADAMNDTSPTLRSGNHSKSHQNGGVMPALLHNYKVRRLMPIECERLQGIEDNYTLIEYRGKPAKDTPRYHGIGNSWAVPVVRWIGERIEMVEELAKELDQVRAA